MTPWRPPARRNNDLDREEVENVLLSMGIPRRRNSLIFCQVIAWTLTAFVL